MARAGRRKIRFLGREKRVPSFSGRRKGGLEKILSKYSPHPQVGERGSGMNHCPTKTGGEKLFCPPTSSLYWVRGRGHRAPWSFKFKTRVEERASAKKVGKPLCVDMSAFKLRWLTLSGHHNLSAAGVSTFLRRLLLTINIFGEPLKIRLGFLSDSLDNAAKNS